MLLPEQERQLNAWVSDFRALVAKAERDTEQGMRLETQPLRPDTIKVVGGVVRRMSTVRLSLSSVSRNAHSHARLRASEARSKSVQAQALNLGERMAP